jgi:DNA-binding NarL/FixJ family response regulator
VYHALDAALPDQSLVQHILELRPDVVLVDVATIRAPSIAKQLSECAAAVRIVAFAVSESEEDVLACVEMGVAGLVGRDASLDDLLLAIDGARRGELHCSPRFANLLFGSLATLANARRPAESRLTSRQREIVLLLDQGLTNKQIAARLSLTESTVKNHVHGLLERLNVRHRWQAMQATHAAATRGPRHV